MLKDFKAYWAEKIAYRLPRSVVYFCLIRAWVFATCGQYGDTEVPTVTIHEVCKRWDEG